MKTQITLLALVTLPAAAFAQTRIYFNEDWEVTTQDKMAYYRETTREGSLYHIRDFYKNGTLQMDALSHNNAPNNEVYEGKVTWYNEDGTEEHCSHYKNGELDGEDFRREKNGDYSRTFYKNGEIMTSESRAYDPESGQTTLEKYSSGGPTTSLTYDKDPGGIREERITDEKGATEIRYYGEGGKLLGTLKDSEDGEMTGTQITFYPKPMRVATIKEYRRGELIADKSYYTTGQLQQEYTRSGKSALQTTYDPAGKVIGRFTFKISEDGEALQQEGVEYTFEEGKIESINIYKNNRITRTEEYKNGRLWQLTEFETGQEPKNIRRQTTYHPDGRVKFVLNYKDGDRYDGTFTNGTNELDYKAGTLLAERTYYEDGPLHYTQTYDRAAGTSTGTVYRKNGEKYNEYLSREDESGHFTGTVAFYTQGRKGKALEFREGLLQGGRMRYFTYGNLEPVELEFDGKNYWLRTYTRGELMKEERTPAKFSEEAPKIDLEDLLRAEPGYEPEPDEVLVDTPSVEPFVRKEVIEDAASAASAVRAAEAAARDAEAAARDAARAARGAR